MYCNLKENPRLLFTSLLFQKWKWLIEVELFGVSVYIRTILLLPKPTLAILYLSQTPNSVHILSNRLDSAIRGDLDSPCLCLSPLCCV
jgi:hypothetical protein